MKIVGYVRVSKEGQKRSGLGIEAQRAMPGQRAFLRQIQIEEGDPSDELDAKVMDRLRSIEGPEDEFILMIWAAFREYLDIAGYEIKRKA